MTSAPPVPHLKEHIMAKLYYDIGRQTTDIAFQHSHKEGEDTIWTKRHTFLELSEAPNANRWFIEHCNHRQILKNEIILDFDRPITPEDVLTDYDIKRIINQLQREDLSFCVYHTGSKGVHIHIYANFIAGMIFDKREQFRRDLIESYMKRFAIGLDLQKASNSTMIAMEHVPHWKTGRLKTLILNHKVDAWMTTR